MAAVICGSLAFDTIMTFEGRFADQILPDQLHILNVSFLVPTLRRDFGGCAGNIAYSLNALGGTALPMATLGSDGASYLDDQYRMLFKLANGSLPDKKYFRVGSAFYLDSQVRFHVKKQFEFYVGVNNLLNTQPPRVITGLPGSVTGTETAAGTYDPIGRRFYSGVRLKF